MVLLEDSYELSSCCKSKLPGMGLRWIVLAAVIMVCTMHLCLKEEARILAQNDTIIVAMRR